ncbi:hypothetical protein [Streptomyces sp. G45]|uniref:hypothetical protein n=1 Tax=Streptomyces sp. G45 TaxID=3406627 RepID=UPI003C1A4530
MPITEEVRKTVTNPTPLFFVVGTADLALQQVKKVPGLIEQVAAEAPSRIEAVRKADPKEVQDRAVARAREVGSTLQTRVGEFISTLDTDLKKLGENAQDLALRGVGVAVEYGVQARETYEKVAEHGEQTVKHWRGEAADEITELAVAVEPDAEPEAAKPAGAEKSAGAEKAAGAEDEAPAAKPAEKKAAPRKAAAKKTTPPAS